MRKWDTQRLNKLPKVTQLGSGGPGNWSRAVWFQSLLWSMMHTALRTSLPGHHLTRKRKQPVWVLGLSTQQRWWQEAGKLTAEPMRWAKRWQHKRLFAKSVWEPESQFTKNKHSSRKVRTSPRSVWACQTPTDTRIIKGKPESASWNCIKKLRKETGIKIFIPALCVVTGSGRLWRGLITKGTDKPRKWNAGDASRNRIPDIPTATLIRSQIVVLKDKKRNEMNSRQNIFM